MGMDTSGVIRFVDHQSELLFGYERADLVGRHVQTLVPDSLWQVFVAHRDDYFADPRTWGMGLDLELSARRRDGTTAAVLALTPRYGPVAATMSTSTTWWIFTSSRPSRGPTPNPSIRSRRRWRTRARFPSRTSAAVVVLLGPLYHLTEQTERVAASLLEARRILKPGGISFAATAVESEPALSGLSSHMLAVGTKPPLRRSG